MRTLLQLAGNIAVNLDQVTEVITFKENVMLYLSNGDYVIVTLVNAEDTTRKVVRPPVAYTRTVYEAVCRAFCSQAAVIDFESFWDEYVGKHLDIDKLCVNVSILNDNKKRLYAEVDWEMNRPRKVTSVPQN